MTTSEANDRDLTGQSLAKMSSDRHVLEYRKQVERKTERFQNNFNDKMLRTCLNQLTRDKNVVMEFIRNERDEKKRDSLWNILRHLSIFVDIYDGCDKETRKKPSYYRSSKVIWDLMKKQTEGGRKIFLVSTSSPCYGFDTLFYSYQITIKGVNGNHLELLEPYMESLDARCLLGDLSNEPIVPFSPLSSARLQSILDISEDPEPQTRDESLVGRELETASLVPELVQESVPRLSEFPVDQTDQQAERDFDDDSSTGWFEIEAAKIIASSGKPQPIGSSRKWIIPIIIGFAIVCLLGQVRVY